MFPDSVLYKKKKKSLQFFIIIIIMKKNMQTFWQLSLNK